MNQKIRPVRATLLAALLCGASTVSLLAQGPGGPPPGGPEHHRHGPPPSPLFDALDANRDGVISADEIAKASDSLKGLLKNGATQLTREDVRPPAPPRPREDDPAAAEGERPPRPKPQGIRPHNPPPHEQDAVEDAHERPVPPPPADEAAAKPGPRDGGPEHRPHHGPPPSPLFDALDANHDGIISEDEMGKAAETLKSMLKPGTNELRREDLRPMHPPHPRED